MFVEYWRVALYLTLTEQNVVVSREYNVNEKVFFS